MLTFNSARSPDLAVPELRALLEWLVSCRAFKVLRAKPPASSFSRAVRPPVRSRTRPAGLGHLSPAMCCKVRADNLLNQWLLRCRDLALESAAAYSVEAPDCAYFWQMPGWRPESQPGSPATFRADLCQFWRKPTRVATNSSLASARLPCASKVRHLRLLNWSSTHRLPWTAVAEHYPAHFSNVLALGLCSHAGWTYARPTAAAVVSVKPKSLGLAVAPGSPATFASMATSKVSLSSPLPRSFWAPRPGLPFSAVSPSSCLSIPSVCSRPVQSLQPWPSALTATTCTAQEEPSTPFGTLWLELNANFH